MQTSNKVMIRVTLNSGNQAIYDCQPQHVPTVDIPDSIQWPVMYGKQVAHESQGLWFYPGGWDEIKDKKLCHMFSNM
jgi:hypothetical protein